VPVVQPRRGAFPEVVETTGGGLIVEADNPEALADGFQLLWRDPAHAAALGAAAAAGVRTHYSVDRMAESVERVYGELAATVRRA
jgi:glycosyltransferase involved in cell wall biosynthesis